MKIRTQRTLAAALVILTVVAWAAVAPRSLWAGADKGPQRVARAAAGVGLPAPGRDFSRVQAGAAYTDGRLLVRFAAPVTPAQRDLALATLGGTLVERVALVPGLCIVALAPGQTVPDALVPYNATPGVLYAEPDYQRVAFSAAQPIQPALIPNASSAAGFVVPNDPLFDRSVVLGGQPVPVSEQWGLLNQFAFTTSTLPSFSFTTSTLPQFTFTPTTPSGPYHDFGLTSASAYSLSAGHPRFFADGTTFTATLGRIPGQDILSTTTTLAGKTLGADIRAPEAWAITTGARTVVVAVVDTGMAIAPGDYIGSDSSFPTDDFYSTSTHTANLWVNTGEIPGNFVDDDGNGYEDDYGGWDFVDKDAQHPLGRPEPFDDDGHGTHVAGIIGARANNGVGIAGVTWNVRLMPLRALGKNGGSSSDVVLATNYAVLMGADVINMSLGGSGFNQAEFDAIQAAGAVGITVVAAAGNDNSSNDRAPIFPANCPLKNVVSVLATDQFDNRASFSNYGATTVDLGAPGTDILSLDGLHPGKFVRMSGTSMAAPMVSGAAALLLSQNASLTADNVRQALLWSAYQPPALPFSNGTYPPLVGTSRSEGRLDLYGALKNIVIQDVQENYFAPSMIEYQYALRSVAGDGITDFLTTATTPGVPRFETFEDGLAVSASESSSTLKAAQKQFRSIVVLDYTNSIQTSATVLAAMENETISFIQSMETQRGNTALFGLYEFHIEDQRPTFVTKDLLPDGFSADAALLADRIRAINAPGTSINRFHGGSRVWDAAFDAVSEFNRPDLTPADEFTNAMDEFRTVVVFTDGNDTSSLKTPADVIALARQLHVRVYFIGYGAELKLPGVSEELWPQTVLEQTAFKTGARYYNSNETGGIALALQRLARDVDSFYVVRWATLKDPSPDAATTTTVPSFRVALTPADAKCPRDRKSEYVGSGYHVADFQGDRRQGALHWGHLEETDTTVRVVLRASYVPRDISHFDFTFPAGIDRVDIVPAPGGLCGTWSPDPADPTVGGTVHIQSPGPALPFASFGPILTFTVLASPTQTARERASDLLSQINVEDTYLDGQSFMIETFGSINPFPPADTIVAKITFKNCTVTAGDAAKGRQLAVAGGTPASSVKIQRILAVPAGVTLVNGVGSGGPGVLYLESNGIAEVVASGSLGILSSDRVPLGDVSVTGTLGTLSTRGCHVDLAEAAAFRSVKMEDLTTSATTSVVGNGLPVPAGFKTATINLVGVSAGQIWLPGQQLTVRAASKRNLDETGVSSVRQANIFNVYGGDVVSVTATGGNVVNSVVARGVLKNVSARGLIVTLSRIRFLFGGFLGVDGNETTTTLTAGGGDAAWMALHPTPGTRPPTVIGSLNGFRGVVVRAVAGYSADTTGGTLVIEPNFTGALQKIGTATFNGTGALTLGIQGNAFISQDAGEIHLSGDKAAVTSGRLVVHRAP